MRALPLNLVYIDAEGAFSKFLGSVTKHGYVYQYKTVQKVDSVSRQGVESLRGVGRPLIWSTWDE